MTSKSIQIAPKRSQRLSGTLPSAEVLGPQPWVPEPYQLEGVAFLLEHAAAGIFLDPGLRKTSITLAAIKILKKENLLGRVLVIAPLRVCYSVWPKEVKKWKDFEHLRVEILHGKDKEEALRRDADIYVINPEGLEWLFGVSKTKEPGKKKAAIRYDLTRFKLLDADTLVIDEISKFKHAQSTRFQILKPLLPKFARRWGLTGSPASNGLLDLFGIMYVIDLGRALGQYITHYRAAYFTPSGYGGYTWVLQEGADLAIYERIAPSVFRLADEDYVKLPKIIENVIKLELPPKVRIIYDELEEEFITQLMEGTVTAANAGAASTKLCQIANGGLFLQQEVDDEGRKESKREWVDLHTVKVEAVQDLLDELNGSPAVITYDFKHDLARLLSALGKDSAVIGGGVSAKKSDLIVEAWNRCELPWLLGHPAAMGHGLNMQDGNAQHVIWHSLTWDYELYDQLVRRLRRSGNKAQCVFVHHIVMKDTVDEAKLLAMRRKQNTQGGVLAAMKEYSAQRSQQLKASKKISKRPPRK
jgi:SNF2 family DNA or RNA helicase